MIAIPAGRYVMGTDREQLRPLAQVLGNNGELHCRNEERRQRFLLARPCYMDRHPVTVAQFAEFLQTLSPSQRRELKLGQVTAFAPEDAELPATGMSWHAAAAYARWRGKRLPTELEWEVGAGWDPASGAMRLFPWGGRFDPQHPRCNLSGRLCSVHDFDAQGPSPLGACDLVGNASEWCADDFRPRYEYHPAEAAGDSAAGTGDGQKAIRGGSCAAGITDCRVACRAGNHADSPSSLIGFRCVMDVVKRSRS
jgi:formylglycine-generating enzyme required for sulfatase activity